MAMLESGGSPFAEATMDPDDVVYPCKGCGEILEEGKAFELAGNRWHIDCFRCNTCGTLLDSDANLLLLGDGSLICNNCTYSCSACHNKIEDLAILTGDQAFCANCFRCRNCKRKIDNLRYARTSQGIFCMSCHESLMARRRKNKKANRNPTPASNGLNKSLPDLPRDMAPQSAFTPDANTPESMYSEGPGSARNSKMKGDRPPALREVSASNTEESRRSTADGQMLLPASTFGTSKPAGLGSPNSKTLSYADGSADFFSSVPFMLDPKDTQSEAAPPSQADDFKPSHTQEEGKAGSMDYFGGPVGNPLRDATFRESLHQEDSPSSISQGGQSQRSPHIASQYRQLDRRTSEQKRQGDFNSTSSPTTTETPPSDSGVFKLEAAPKQRKPSSRRGSKGEGRPPLASTTGSEVKGLSRTEQLRNAEPSPRIVDRRLSYASDDFPSPSLSSPTNFQSMAVERPKRGDSLAAAAAAATQTMQTVPRKEVGSAGTSGATTPTAATHSQGTNGTRNVTKPIDSLDTRTILDPPPRAPSRLGPSSRNSGIDDVFTAPRAAPPAPTRQPPSASTSGLMSGSESSIALSPKLPRSSTGPEFSMDEEMDSIINPAESARSEREDKGENGMLRKMSNAVKHGRSFSDRAARSERSSASGKGWRSPLHGSMEISSPTSATSPNVYEENVLLKNKLRQAQERVAKLEMEKNGLQTMVASNVDMTQVNTELKEKRSTMAFLDTQREIVVRELEVMTEHLRKAKDSNQALDVTELKSGVSRDFAATLQKLKDTLGKQVEDLMQTRHELTREIDDLIQMKDKGFQEYESLSSRNHQLTQHNNELISSIQGNMKANAHHLGHPVSSPFDGPPRGIQANGLGLYLQPTQRQSSRSESIDTRDTMHASSEYSQASTLLQDGDPDSAIVQQPHVVKIGKAKANMLKKGTQGFVKGLRNMRGQLQEKSDRMDRQVSMPYSLEATPYSQMPQGTDLLGQYSNPNSRGGLDAAGKQKFGGLFGERGEKGQYKHVRPATTLSSSNLTSDAAGPAHLAFGADLSQRCDFERRVLPSIVARCVQEVELRGMDVEGIYRKSGGTGQVNQIRAGFEREAEFDISDPDLDIHAVTSALKQYLRKLPTPLITYEVYERLLECARLEDRELRLQPMKDAIMALPKAHKDTLEFIVFHLAKVMSHEKVNLMTPLNLAVVFAPTIMRPQSIEREMIDMQLQRVAVQSILEMNEELFAYGEDKEESSGNGVGLRR